MIVYPLFVLFLVIFAAADCICYCESPFPERCHWWSILPGSGFVTLYQALKDK